MNVRANIFMSFVIYACRSLYTEGHIYPSMSFVVIFIYSWPCWFHHAFNLFVSVSPIYRYGFSRLEEWHTCGILRHITNSWTRPHTCASSPSQHSCQKQCNLVSFIHQSWQCTSWNQHIEVLAISEHVFHFELCVVGIGILTFTSMCRLVWPPAKIFLCLWHVRKAWAVNVMKKMTLYSLIGDFGKSQNKIYL